MRVKDEGRVRLSVSGGVAEVALARLHRHNGLDRAMFQALNDAQDRVAADRTVRAVVLTGDGPSFCAGLDFESVAAEGTGPEALLVPWPGSPANLVQRAAYGWTQLAVPVVAALRGHCLGGGCQIALAADVRYAAPDACLSLMEVRFGLVPDLGLSQTLPRLVRADVAKELVWTGRVVDAQEALTLGLVTHVVEDPLAAARALAAEIATMSPDAVRAGKRLLVEAWNASPEVALPFETDLQRSLLSGPNHQVALAAGTAGTVPQFDDPA